MKDFCIGILFELIKNTSIFENKKAVFWDLMICPFKKTFFNDKQCINALLRISILHFKLISSSPLNAFSHDSSMKISLVGLLMNFNCFHLKHPLKDDSQKNVFDGRLIF